jgi:tRNA (guanine-N7-)-methyltransferase
VNSNCASLKTEPSPAAASLLISLDTIVEPLDAGKVFLRRQPLQVELGSGDGSFLVQYAALHPEWNFIGVERLLGRLRKIERKGQRAGLANLRGIRIEAAYFLEYLLPKNLATALHIYFPDPWPKRKHHKHRLINERFPQLARTALVPGGAVYLRTDDADYFAQMTAVFEACPSFAQIPTPQSLSEVLTDFERGFLAKGIQTLRSAWQLMVP